jgi:segregation and condensation protein A
VGAHVDGVDAGMSDEGTNASYRVELPEFEGPLDLLLHLCKTNEIDIVNIPISFITQKYLEYLDVMQTLSVDVAADYLVMAATLAYLKSRELVPVPEPLVADEEGGDEVLDPREELIRRLLEYRKYKDAAEQLGNRPIEGKNVFGRGMPIEDGGGPSPFADHSVWKLIEAFGKLLEKAGPKIAHEVRFDRVSISSRINQIIDRLELGGGSFRFDSLFDMATSEPELRSQLVVTLLAILELARLKVVRVLASEDQETLFISQVQGAPLTEARRAHVTSDDEAEEEGEAAADAEAADVPAVEPTVVLAGQSTDPLPAEASPEDAEEQIVLQAAAVTEPAADPVIESAEVPSEAPLAFASESVIEPVEDAVSDSVDAFTSGASDTTVDVVSHSFAESESSAVQENTVDTGEGDDTAARDTLSSKESHEET